MIIFDLNKTLFDTELLKKDFEKIFEAHELRGQEFWKSFYKAYDFDSKNLGCYSIDKHLKSLNIDDEKRKTIKKNLNFKMEYRGTEYLYPEVIYILENLKANNNRLLLISRGDKNFEKKKIFISGLDRYFDKIIIVPKITKSVIKNNIKKGERIFYIGHNINDLWFIGKNFPKIDCVFLRRYKQILPKNFSITTAENLSDIIWYFGNLSVNNNGT